MRSKNTNNLLKINLFNKFRCGSWLIFDVAVGYGPIIQHLSPIPHFFVTIFCVMKTTNFSE